MRKIRLWSAAFLMILMNPQGSWAEEAQGASASSEASGENQELPDFKERAETLENMIQAHLEQAVRGQNLTSTQKQARALREALILIEQLKFYIVTFGIHDTYTTSQEIHKFRAIVEPHIDAQISH